METPQRTALRKCRVRLVKDLQMSDMFDSIEAQGIFTDIMLECVKAKESRPEQVRACLDYLQRRGPDAFDKFLLCLQETGHGFVKNYLLHEYTTQVGQGTPHVNLTPTSPEPPSPPQGPLNIYHTQESQTLGNQGLTTGNQGLTTGSQSLTSGSQPVQDPVSAPHEESMVVSGTPECQIGVTLGSTAPASYQETKSVACTETSEPMVVGDEEPHTSAAPLSSSVQESSAANDVRGEQNSMAFNDIRSSNPRPTLSSSSSSSSVTSGLGYTGNLDEQYKMESTPRGSLLIINNRDFRTMNNRAGTDLDCKNLEILFKRLGFGVDIRENLTALEILATLQALSNYTDLQGVDSLAVAVLTHGSEEVLYGVDGKYIHVNEALKPFTSECCPFLHHKPKLFIINACRGDQDDRGSAPNSELHSNVMPDVETLPRINTQPSRIPKMMDFLLAFSTIPGHVSWRSENEGSWFIQGLVKVFSEQASTRDVVNMLVKVNREVSRNISNDCVQLPAPQVMLTREWYLNPI